LQDVVVVVKTVVPVRMELSQAVYIVSKGDRKDSRGKCLMQNPGNRRTLFHARKPWNGCR
jgi:hypothetical protein